MKFYGHANLQQNELQNAVLTTLTSFPAVPVVGQFCFVNKVVYVCVTAGSLPVWVPLTAEISAYTFIQSTAATSWAISHTLNTTSVVAQIYDGAGNSVIPDNFTTTGPGTAVATFSTAITGRAVLVTGQFDGNTKPTYAYTFYQNTAATTWTIVHNLGYNPIVRVFIGTSEVQPSTITFPDLNTAVITFSTAQVGYARLM